MRFAVITVLLLGGVFVQTSQSADGSGIEELTRLMQGEFRGVVSSADDPEGSLMIDRRVQVQVPALGQPVIYWQINSGAELALYRQRLLTFHQDPEGQVIYQRTWSFVDAEAWLEAGDKPSLLRTLDVGDVVPSLPESCRMSWRIEPGGWRGYLDPGDCRIWSERHQEYRHIEGESRLNEGGLSQAERGYDEEGRQLFGTPAGALHSLERQ